MSYIVKNCPAYQKELITMNFKTGETKATDKNYCINHFLPNNCQYCTDCVIKQVIEKCVKMSGKCERCKTSEDYQPTDCLNYCSNDDVIFADDILQLFDIEEINK